ncbi:hypothetical protein Poly30_20490 [Planctomycetes bacterium Poly30]|uniref:Nickel uptake substrate-specific transmembrane region n=2 Tax=Saltatorellus ferox TaxID=2528018 RepID=A0A518ER28_9BACT|nr:hypothetical protein Poly30_20490 [Planctomycetes bacterium Poly30]
MAVSARTLALVVALHGASIASATSDLRVVDPEGKPVAGVTLEIVDRQLGTFSESDLPLLLTSDDEGRISLEDIKRPPIDLRLATVDGGSPWAIRYVHGKRLIDENAGADLDGAKPRVYDLSEDIVCVVEESGTIQVQVAGARESDRFHATFLDQRPEPESHRNVVASGSFTGGSGSFRVPAGRGTVYLYQEGYVGAPVLTRDSPLMVAVAPGGTASVAVRFLEGPTTRLLAPFDMIPFQRIEALAPDGRTVIGEFAFDASPLRLPSRIAVVTGAANAPSEIPPMRLPKQLLRAVDVPLALPALELPDEVEGAERFVDRAPMELLFTVDPGLKIRLPEAAGGWIDQARGGLSFLSNTVQGMKMLTGIEHPAPSRVLVAGAGSGAAWQAAVTVRDAEGAVRPYVEVLVAAPGSLLARGITGADGVIHVEGIRADSVALCLVDSVADQVSLARPEPGAGSAAGVIVPGDRVELSGTWKRSPQNAGVGDLIVLVPASEEAIMEQRRFMTRAAPIAFLDAAGTFDFGSVPRGLYTLRAGSQSEAAIDLRVPEEEKARSGAGSLELSGTGASFEAVLTSR